ncbi:MAG: hypothetical protein J6Y94_06155 [Bacteriovoracaceae bacterium]|nr:hypothetical protein [Bacteriovoracaceae bacterium]
MALASSPASVTSSAAPATATENARPKALVIRFSSFGDIVQCLPVAEALRTQLHAEVHWAVRADMEDVVRLDPQIHPWPLPRLKGWPSVKVLWAMAKNLYKEDITYIYDAHTNLRSFLLLLFFRILALRDKKLSWIKRIKGNWQFARRAKNRFKRMLLFNLQVNLFPRPYLGAISYLKPLAKWKIAANYTPAAEINLPPLPDLVRQELLRLEGLSKLTQTEEKKVREATAGDIVLPPPEVLAAAEIEAEEKEKAPENVTAPAAAPASANQANSDLSSSAADPAEKPLPYFVAIAPSAAWPLKRWPLAYWKELINLNPHVFFIVLGGPRDHFCQELVTAAPDHVSNTAGHLSLLESCAVVQHAHAVISADTGILHVADYLKKPGIALLGPTAFGRPSGNTLHVLETALPCRPCSKDGSGSCYRSIQQECLMSISPLKVSKVLQEIICATFNTTPEDLAEKQGKALNEINGPNN